MSNFKATVANYDNVVWLSVISVTFRPFC